MFVLDKEMFWLKTDNNFFFSCQNKPVMAFGLIAITVCVAYLGYLHATIENKKDLYEAIDSEGSRYMRRKTSKWDWEHKEGNQQINNRTLPGNYYFFSLSLEIMDKCLSCCSIQFKFLCKMPCLYKWIAVKIHVKIKVTLRIVVCKLHGMSEDMKLPRTCSQD